jgi:hypothetical protein
MQLVLKECEMAGSNIRELATKASTRIREFAFDTKTMENKANQQHCSSSGEEC